MLRTSHILGLIALAVGLGALSLTFGDTLAQMLPTPGGSQTVGAPGGVEPIRPPPGGEPGGTLGGTTGGGTIAGGILPPGGTLPPSEPADCMAAGPHMAVYCSLNACISGCYSSYLSCRRSCSTFRCLGECRNSWDDCRLGCVQSNPWAPFPTHDPYEPQVPGINPCDICQRNPSFNGCSVLCPGLTGSQCPTCLQYPTLQYCDRFDPPEECGGHRPAARGQQPSLAYCDPSGAGCAEVEPEQALRSGAGAATHYGEGLWSFVRDGSSAEGLQLYNASTEQGEEFDPAFSLRPVFDLVGASGESAALSVVLEGNKWKARIIPQN